jgi:hypothetical protein
MTSHMGKRGSHMGRRVHTWAKWFTYGQKGSHMGKSVHIWAKEFTHGQKGSHMGKRVHTWVKGVYMGKIYVLTVGQFHVYYIR